MSSSAAMFRTKKRRSSIPEAGSRPSRIFESSRNRSERGLAAARPDLEDVGPRRRGCPISRVFCEKWGFFWRCRRTGKTAGLHTGGGQHGAPAANIRQNPPLISSVDLKSLLCPRILAGRYEGNCDYSGGGAGDADGYHGGRGEKADQASSFQTIDGAGRDAYSASYVAEVRRGGCGERDLDCAAGE